MKGADPPLPAICQSSTSHVLVAQLKTGLLSEEMKFSEKYFYKSNLIPKTGGGEHYSCSI